MNTEKMDSASQQSSREEVVVTTSIGKEDIEQRPTQFPSLLHEILCLTVFCFSTATASISTGSFQISIDKTAEHFNVTGGIQTWLVGSISLANGSFLLLMGGIADGFGRKNSIVVCYAAFAVCSLIAGFMKNFIALCIFRALSGIFVAGATPAAAGIIGSIYKEGSQRKNRATAVFSAGAPLGSISGFIIGGICVQFITWRAIHFFYAILFAVLSAISAFVVPNDKPHLKYEDFKQSFLNLDFIGSGISLASFVLICFSLTQVDATSKGWGTSYIIACLVVGVVLLVVFVLYEIYFAFNPIMPTQIWANRNFSISMIIMSLSWLQFQGVVTYYGVLYFETIKHYSPLLTTACYLPMQVVGVATNIFAALTLHLIPGTILMIFGCTGFLVSAIIWATLDMNRNYWLGPFWSFSTVVLGADLTYNVSNLITFSSVSHEFQSSAAGILNTIIQLSGTIGLGLSSTIISAKNPAFGTEHQNDDLVKLFNSFTYAYYFACGCAAVALLLSFTLKVGKFTNEEAENKGKVDDEKVIENSAPSEEQL